MNDERFDMLEESIKDTVVKMFETHVAENHYPISNSEVDRLIAEGKEYQIVVKRVVEMLEGKPVVGPSGNVIAREDGLMQTAQKSNAMLVEIDRRTNGGVTVTQKINWTPKTKIAAWTAFGVFITQTLATLAILLGG